MKRMVCAVVSALFAVSAVQGGEAASIEGQVLVEHTGEPVAGATVILLETRASTVADRQGEFQFKGLQSGRYHIYAHLENALQGNSQVIEVASAETATARLLLSFSAQRTEITVSAAGRQESAFESFQSTHSLTALELARAENIAAGLGEAIGNQPGTGIAQRGFGPGSSRPLIRGFDGDRVLIMTDGLRTGSISSTSGDHAETFNPLAFERVEVVKGPATLLYGSNAMGGVVNAIGFLGAGKTTLLNHALHNREGRRVAVIVNDMSEVNIDAQLVRNGGAELNRVDERLIEMSKGCICCTLREDLLEEVGRLAREGRFDYLLIESIGISEPLPVAATFALSD